MTDNLPTNITVEVRSLLNDAFDDSGLRALCLDEFPELFEHLGRGMRKDEIITQVLDHFRRHGDFRPLLETVLERQPEIYARHESDWSGAALRMERRSGELLPYETAMAYNFDLIELVNDCLDSLFEKRGLVGFGIACHSPVFLGNFCERLKHEWGRNKVCLKPTLVVNPFYMPLDEVLTTVYRRYIPALRETDVLFAVQISAGDVLSRFWQDLALTIEDRVFRNRLITILSVAQDCALPAGIISLGQPRFRRAHIWRWVSQIVQYLAWPQDIVEFWTDEMFDECRRDDELQLDWVYDHLDEMLNLLKQNPTVGQFQQELEKRRQRYVKTSH